MLVSIRTVQNLVILARSPFMKMPLLEISLCPLSTQGSVHLRKEVHILQLRDQYYQNFKIPAPFIRWIVTYVTLRKITTCSV